MILQRRNLLLERRFRLGFLSSALLAGLSFLCKGPLGPLLICLTLTLFLLVVQWNQQTTKTKKDENLTVASALFEFVPWSGMLGIFALTALPWFIAMCSLHGPVRYLNTFLGYHHLSRYLTGVNWHGDRPLWFSFAMILAISFPWGLGLLVSTTRGLIRLLLLLPGVLWLKQRRREKVLEEKKEAPDVRTETETDSIGEEANTPSLLNLKDISSLEALCWCWILAVMLILCPSASQLPSYYLPLLPPLCILCGNQMMNDPKPNSNSMEEEGEVVWASSSFIWSMTTAASVMALAVGLAVAPSMLSSSADEFTARLGAALCASSRYYWVGLMLLAVCSLLFAGFAIADRIHRRRRRPKTIKDNQKEEEEAIIIKLRRCVLPAIVSALIFVTLGFQRLVADFDSVRQFPLRCLCQHAVFHQRPEAAVASIGLQMPSCVYYTKRPVAFFDDFTQAAREVNRLRLRNHRNKDTPLLFLVSSENYKTNVQKHFLSKLKPKKNTLQVIASQGGYLLFQL
jgi:4-amino-4-deoxy-L-arabinose transferase-like glycosyltransferase